MVYVLVISIGHVPDVTSLLSTAKLAFDVQSSLIVKPIPSNSATVVAAAGASNIEQPSTVEVAILPEIEGEVLSSTLILIGVALAVQPFPSLTLKVTG